MMRDNMMGMSAMPIGIIDEPIGTGPAADGARYTLTRPKDSEDLKPGMAVTVWNFHQDYNAGARFRGEITEISRTTGSFKVMEAHVDPDWPRHIEPLGVGNPVYLAVPGSFFPDLNRTCSPEELDMLKEFAQQHREETGIEPSTGVIFAALVEIPGFTAEELEDLLDWD